MSVKSAAETLIAAALNGQQVGAIAGLIDGEASLAYAVQDQIAEHRKKSGGVQVGWKVAFSAKPVMAAFGISEPASGRLFADMEVMSGATLPWAETSSPRVEAEIAFVMGRSLKKAPIGMADLLAATEFVIPAIEVVGTRISGALSAADAISDNAGGSQFVPGSTPKRLTDVDVARASMRLLVNGKEVAAGTGANVYGSPANAVLWLARHLTDRGLVLRKGDIVMAGALAGPVPVSPGDEVVLESDGFGSVCVNFGEA